MNNAQMAKIFGWGQFGLQTLETVFAEGIPTTPLGWVLTASKLLASLGVAGGLHLSSNTDGTK